MDKCNFGSYVLAACSEGQAPKNQVDLVEIIENPALRVCKLDMSHFEQSERRPPNQSASATIRGVIERYENQRTTDLWAMPLPDYETYHRRIARTNAALNLIEAGNPNNVDVDAMYQHLLEDAPPSGEDSNNLDILSAKLAYWSDKLRSFHESYARSNYTAENWRELCIIKEQLGTTRARARSLLLARMKSETADLNGPAELFIIQDVDRDQRGKPKVFLNAVLAYAQSQDTLSTPVANAIFLARDSGITGYLVENDHRKASRLIEQHRAEARARLSTISSTSFSTLEDEVIERSNLTYHYERFSQVLAISPEWMASVADQVEAHTGILEILEEVSASNADALERIYLADTDWYQRSISNSQVNISVRLARTAIHTKNVEVMKQTVSLLEIENSRKHARNLYGALIDMIEIAEGRDQVFGTQGICRSRHEFEQFPLSSSPRARELRESFSVDADTDAISGIVPRCQYYLAK